MFEQFKTFSETLITVTWSLFDIFQYDGLLHSHVVTYRIILVLVLVHSIIGTVIILNMLIAMLNNTYQQIQENVDMEWKFSRSALFSEYKEGIPWLFPFSLIVIPLCLACRAYNSYAKWRTNDKDKKHASLQYGKGLDLESDVRDTEVNSGHIVADETDGIVVEAAFIKPDLEDPDPVKHEIQMRYLLINMLGRRHSQRKYCSNQSPCAYNYSGAKVHG
ncbi:short transient receptor potential channel 5-like [Bolinopsis microptera]|uniref:short transient receptor potential channel 5-like n=1 Tax=Bolinopsis microptera TaxID=2820187 RepID=UPI0030799D43